MEPGTQKHMLTAIYNVQDVIIQGSVSLSPKENLACVPARCFHILIASLCVRALACLAMV